MDAKPSTTRIRRHGRWHLAGAALAMACGGTAAVGPSAVYLAPEIGAAAVEPSAAYVEPEIGADWNPIAWLRERPCYTQAELAEVRARFDAATQIERDYFAAVAPPPPSRGWAIATVEPAGRSSSRAGRGHHGAGVVRFEQDRRQVVMRATLSGLPPGEHGFTIDDAGSCAEVRGRPAGHWNPTQSQHGPIDSRTRHAGDFGNLTVDAGGNATFVVLTDSFQVIGEGSESVVGKTVVIHARRDDGKTQPSGNSGPAVACGVVRPSGAQVATGD